MEIIKIFFGELLGTAIYTGFGCLGAVRNRQLKLPPMMTGLHLGIIKFLTIFAFGHISGGHGNPSVTISAFLLKKLSFKRSLVYLVAQFLGGYVGYYLLFLVLPIKINNVDIEAPTCQADPIHTLSDLNVFAVEYALSTVLICVWAFIWFMRNDHVDVYGIFISLTIVVCSYIAEYYTGTTMNPAKTLIPAFVHGNVSNVLMQLYGELLAAFCTPVLLYFIVKIEKIPFRHDELQQD